MAKHYLIDGYNLMHRFRGGRLKPGPGNLESAREALLRWISSHKGDARVTVVFDASRSTAPGLADYHREGLRVVFPIDFASADEWLIEEIRASAGAVDLVVVTSDRTIQQAAKRSRIAFLESGEFIARLSEAEHERTRPAQEDSPRKESAPQSLELTETEREAFRQVMKEEPEPPREKAAPKRPPAPPSVPPPPEKPRGTGEDLSDFYRQMRSFEDEISGE